MLPVVAYRTRRVDVKLTKVTEGMLECSILELTSPTCSTGSASAHSGAKIPSARTWPRHTFLLVQAAFVFELRHSHWPAHRPQRFVNNASATCRARVNYITPQPKRNPSAMPHSRRVNNPLVVPPFPALSRSALLPPVTSPSVSLRPPPHLASVRSPPCLASQCRTRPPPRRPPSPLSPPSPHTNSTSTIAASLCDPPHPISTPLLLS